MKTPKTRREWRDRLLVVMQESGLSSGAFAEKVLTRDPRTVRRWVKLETPIPQAVQDWLLDPRPAPWPVARCEACGEEIR